MLLKNLLRRKLLLWLSEEKLKVILLPKNSKFPLTLYTWEDNNEKATQIDDLDI
jgi:hypothetical protein